MFGRSGQMFPRRAYHDAIYEEEYGSETEEECCRGRGLSAILCWFLSVIILVGLAASVVLTVFFILKSRSVLAKNNLEDFNPDLNFALDHGNGFKVPPTTTDDDNFTSPSKVPIGEGSEEVPVTTTYVETRTTRLTTTTRIPPTTRLTTRKYWSDTTGGPHGETTAMPPTTQSNSMFKFLFNTIKTFQNNEPPQYGESIEQTPIDEVISNESVERFVPHPPPQISSPTPPSYFPTTSRTFTSTSPVLFTLPPNTSTMSQYNKKNSTTRFPERTSFSSEDTSSTTFQQAFDQNKANNQPAVSSSEEVETTSEISTTLKPSLFPEETHKQEESNKLKKMLIDQIPPHGNDDNAVHLTTSTTPSPPSVITEDLLSKIIKNLQPKWNKTRHELTTSVGPPRTRNRYVELDRHSVETKFGENGKFKRVKVRVTTTSPPTTVIFITPEKPETTLPATDAEKPESSESVTNLEKGHTLSPNHGIELIQSPNLNPKDKDNVNESIKDNAFLDILVGSDDHKTLITKQTDAGIITSAILPPWFDTSNNSTDTLELTNQTLKFTKTDIMNDDGDDNDDNKNNNSKPKSDLDILLNLFSNSPLPKDGSNRSSYPKSETYIPETSPEEASRKTHLKHLEEQFKPFFSSPSDDDSPTGSGTQRVTPANNAFHYGSSDGTTHIFGYYPEEDLDEGESMHHVEIDINDKRQNASIESHEDPQNLADSHVIDIAFDPKAQPEIVIEPEGEGEGEGEGDDAEYSDNDNYSDVIEPMAAGSDIHKHEVYAPPPKNLNLPPESNLGSDLGSGIRRPTVEDDGDLYVAANEPKVQQSDWSMKHVAPGESPNSEDPEYVEEEMSDETEEMEKGGDNPRKDLQVESPYSSEDSSNVDDPVLERKPILKAEESLVKNDVAGGTTAKPRVRVYEVYSEPFKTSTPTSGVNATENPVVTLKSNETAANNKSGFIPPKPINFHDNPFAPTNSEFITRDGWRPVVYDGNSNQKNRISPQNKQPNGPANGDHSYFLSTSMQPPPFSASPPLQITTPIRSPPTTVSNMNPPDEYEDEGSIPSSNEYAERPSVSDSRGSESKLKIKPSVQIPMPGSNPPARVKFPENENQHVMNRQQMVHVQHPSGSSGPGPGVQNNFIDRAKYAHRPVRPPILMRRKPPFSMPFTGPNRKRNKTQQGNGMPNRNFPRGPYPASGSSGPSTGPFQHPENPNIRHRNDFINSNPPPPQGNLTPPGTVHWPNDENFVRRNIPPGPPPHMNRRPMG